MISRNITFNKIDDRIDILSMISYLNNISQGMGLYKGYMGVAVTISALSHNVPDFNPSVYIVYYIKKIMDMDFENMESDFENGLLGIGWGLHYLRYKNPTLDLRFANLIDGNLQGIILGNNANNSFKERICDYMNLKKTNDLLTFDEQYLDEDLSVNISRILAGLPMMRLANRIIKRNNHELS